MIWCVEDSKKIKRHDTRLTLYQIHISTEIIIHHQPNNKTDRKRQTQKLSRKKWFGWREGKKERGKSKLFLLILQVEVQYWLGFWQWWRRCQVNILQIHNNKCVVVSIDIIFISTSVFYVYLCIFSPLKCFLHGACWSGWCGGTKREMDR